MGYFPGNVLFEIPDRITSFLAFVNHRDNINIPDISQVVAFLTFPLKYFNSYYSLEQILIQPFINPIYSLEIYPLIIISSSDMYYSLPAIERSCMNCPLCCVLAQVVIRQLQPQLWSTLNPL